MSRRRQVSESRQAAFYIGTGIQIVGALLFGSVFISGCLSFGDFDNFDSDTKSMMGRAIGGMALLIVGGAIRTVGQRGAAGAGLILDPEAARRDLEPFSRQAGGMLGDALDEAGLKPGSTTSDSPGSHVVMVRCLGCDFLNEEDSKFCQECGRAMRPT